MFPAFFSPADFLRHTRVRRLHRCRSSGLIFPGAFEAREVAWDVGLLAALSWALLRVLAAAGGLGQGYDTAFLCGGYGHFDNMSIVGVIVAGHCAFSAGQNELPVQNGRIPLTSQLDDASMRPVAPPVSVHSATAPSRVLRR